MVVQRNEKAVVTLVVGGHYTERFLLRARPTWESYCQKHDYDLILLTEPIDKDCDFSRKSIHWQKLLIGLLPQLKEYRHLVWIDGDVIINYHLAPCIVSTLKENKIGAVDISSVFSRNDFIFNLHTRYLILNYIFCKIIDADTPKAIITDGDLPFYYRRLGFRGKVGKFINTGVLVFDPNTYGRFLAECYAKYEKDFMDYENTPLSYELQSNDVVEFLNGKFNMIWAQVVAEHYPFLFSQETVKKNKDLFRLCANAAYHNSWFLHFAGGSGNPIVKSAFDLIDHPTAGVPDFVFPDFWPENSDLVEFCKLPDIDETRQRLGDEARTYMNLF